MAKYLIVGAGLSGLTVARILKDQGNTVLVLEKNHYVGGTCADFFYDGYFIGLHGPHIVHTNDKAVWDFLSRFTEWISYQHRVDALTNKGVIPVPFNDISRSIVGDLNDEEVINLLFRHYSMKMWGLDWERLPEFITKRVPSKNHGNDCRYFQVKYEGIPKGGYSSIFMRMSEGIDVALGVDKDEWRRRAGDFDKVIYCGRPDEAFKDKFGILNYRSLQFEMRHGYQLEGACVLNNCTEEGPTRITDYSKMYGLQKTTTPLVSEHPCNMDSGSPYYPMWDNKVYDCYRKESISSGILLLGRLATYSYLDMGQSVRMVLDVFHP